MKKRDPPDDGQVITSQMTDGVSNEASNKCRMVDTPPRRSNPSSTIQVDHKHTLRIRGMVQEGSRILVKESEVVIDFPKIDYERIRESLAADQS
jgi:hypothetical protein